MKSKKLCIDRFEGDFAICENENGLFENIKKTAIPKTAKEGDILRNNSKDYVVDEDETAKRHAEISCLQDELFS